MPYVTGIATTNRTKSGLKDNNIRSASGKYSIMYAANNSATTYAADFITVQGFNLNPAENGIRIVDSATAKGTSVDTSTGIKGLRSAAAASPYTSVSISNVISKSGYLEIITNGVRSLNNINNDDAYGTAKNSAGAQLSADNATVTDYTNAYNREPDYYTTKNVQLTDDRYLVMWDMKKTNTKNGYYPVMIIDKNDGDKPVFGYVDANGDSSGTVSTGYAAYYMPQRRKFKSDGTVDSTEYLVGGTTFEQMAMAKDSAGKYIQASVYNRESGSMGVYYNDYASSYWGSGYDGWQMPGTVFNKQNYDSASAASNNALSIEGMKYGGLLIDRYQNLKLIASGNSTTAAGAVIYMAYYDDYYGSIVYRNMKIGTNRNTIETNNLSTGYYTNQTEITANTGSATGRNTVTTTGSKYYDFGITSDIAVFVYYDFNAGRLRLMYSSSATTANSTAKAVDGNPNTTVSFCENTNIQLPDYVGQYVSMAIDSTGGIHIAAFDANDSDLKYIYLTSYNATSYTEMTVDAAGSVGNWTSIKIKNNVPYIAYYNATETGGRDAIKLAYANATIGSITEGIDSSTSYTATGWEYMTIPSVDPAQGGSQKFQQVCLDFDSSGNPVVGYLGTNLEFGKQLTE